MGGEVFEACCRCRWWSKWGRGEQVLRGDHGQELQGDCYAHMNDAGGWHSTRANERCPQFTGEQQEPGEKDVRLVYLEGLLLSLLELSLREPIRTLMAESSGCRPDDLAEGKS